jgi:hypothetical protein
MTSRPATDAPCEGCPDVPYPPAPDIPKNRSPNRDEILKRLPQGTSGDPLPEKPELTYNHVWGVYLGGTPEDHLVSVIFVIPEGFDRIIAHPDGSLEYTKKGLDGFEPPSPINGYERDTKNPWLFRPLWESCVMRHYGIVVKEKCQCIDVIAKCSVNAHWVRYEDCLKCEARLPIKSPMIPVHKTRATLRLPTLGRSSK